MKIKKLLKDERKKIDERILADGQDLYNELASQYCKPKTQKKNSSKAKLIRWLTAVSCVIVVCLVVGLSVGLTQQKPPQYLEQNAIRVSSSMEEFIDDTKSTINFGNDYAISKITRIDDSESLDKLYYHIEFEHKDELIWGELFVVVNSDYHFTERHVSEIQKSNFNGYDMEFSVREYLIEDFSMNEYFGCISLSNYKIYFSFEELQENNLMLPDAVLVDLLILK